MTKRTVPTPTGPLAGLAIRVRDNARLLHSLRTDARQIQELKEREQRLRGLADQSTSLANSARLLRDAGRPPTIPSAIALALHDVADYRQRGQVRVTRIEEALRQAEASLLATWRAPFAAIESARALAVLLERFPQLKTARLRIQHPFQG